MISDSSSLTLVELPAAIGCNCHYSSVGYYATDPYPDINNDKKTK